MFKISKKVTYALISLKHMSGKTPGQLTSAKEICDTFATPFDPTSRVLQLMAQKGILRAAQGAHGGYQIISDLSLVTMGELSEAVAGPIRIADCVDKSARACELGRTCNVKGAMASLNKKVNEVFSEIHVRDLLGLNAKTEDPIEIHERGLPQTQRA